LINALLVIASETVVRRTLRHGLGIEDPELGHPSSSAL